MKLSPALLAALALHSSIVRAEEPTATGPLPKAGSASGGASGYGRLVDTTPLRAGVVRAGLRAGIFQGSDFPVVGTDRLLVGELNLGYGVLPFLEVYGTYHTSSNANSASTPALVQTQGDVTIGGKVGWQRERFRYGADLRLNLRNGIGADAWSLGTSSAHVRGLGGMALDVAGRPLFLDVNLGLVFGAASVAFDPRMTPALLFGSGLSGYHQLQAAVGARYEVGRFTPFAALAADAPLGLATEDLAASSTSAFGATAKRLTLGTRIDVGPAGAVDVLAEFASGRSVKGWSPTQPWMLFAAYSFAFDPGLYGAAPPPPQVAAPEPSPAPPAPTTGQLAGQLVDAETRVPVTGALIQIKGAPRPPVGSGSDGRFLTHELGAGTVMLEIERGGYEPLTVEARVEAGQVATIDVALKAKPVEPPPAPVVAPPPPPPVPVAPIKPEQGWVTGHVEALFGKPAGIVRLENQSQSLETKLDADGRFSLRAPVGAYELVVLPEKHIAARSRVDITSDTLPMTTVRLFTRPVAPAFKVVEDRVVPNAAVRLDEKKPAPAPADKPLLLGLSDLVNLDGSTRLSIQVHADAPARPGDDRKQWTEERAQALREAIVGFGVPAERVEAKGFGLEQPIVPSISPKKAKNRRVEFVLIKSAPVRAPEPQAAPEPKAAPVPTPDDVPTPEIE